jgi:hypothetical protein
VPNLKVSLGPNGVLLKGQFLFSPLLVLLHDLLLLMIVFNYLPFINKEDQQIL